MLDINSWIAAGGLLLIGLIIFGESGIAIGFFLPGDTLLISAGVFAASGKLSLAAVILVAASAAIIGDNIGYNIGHFAGPRLFKKDRKYFRQEHVKQAKDFFDRYGNRLFIIAHFLPVIRSFLPIVAGIGRMGHTKFMIFDAIGDIIWAVTIPTLGYFVGSKFPGLDKYVLLLVLVGIAVSFGPAIYHLHKKRKIKHRTKSAQNRAKEEKK